MWAVREDHGSVDYWGDASELQAPSAVTLNEYSEFYGVYEFSYLVNPEEYVAMPRDPQELADYLIALHGTSAAHVAFPTRVTPSMTWAWSTNFRSRRRPSRPVAARGSVAPGRLEE